MTCDNPKITVVIPIYNGEGFISETLNSLKQQTLSDFEVICVDDCSTDNSKEIVLKFCLADSRFRYIQTPENFGYAAKVINFAISHINGLYYMYSSQDDLFSHDLFEKALGAAEAVDADFVIPDLEFYYPQQEINVRKVGVHGDRSIVLNGKEAFRLSLDWTIPGNGIVRTKLIKRYKYFDFGTYADGYTARYFLLKSDKITFCDGVFFYRQDNPEAITKKISPKRLDWPYTAYRIWELTYDNFPKSRESRFCAVRAVRSLLYAEMMILKNPELKIHYAKVNNARQNMRTKIFISEIMIIREIKELLEAIFLLTLLLLPNFSKYAIYLIFHIKKFMRKSG